MTLLLVIGKYGYAWIVGDAVDDLCSISEIVMGYASGHYNHEMAVSIAAACVAAKVKVDGNGAMVALGVGMQKAKMMMCKVMSGAKVSSGLWIAGINSLQAVTVAGEHKLINGLVALAKDPSVMVFATKLQVSCAFHMLLMEAQELTLQGPCQCYSCPRELSCTLPGLCL